MDDLPPERLRATTAAVTGATALLERVAARERQHLEFVARADAWARDRAGDEPVAVVYPLDAAAIAALGVPCDDCLTLVHADGEREHRIRYGAANGLHWAALISAHCGRTGL